MRNGNTSPWSATSPATPSCGSPPTGQANATFGLAVNRRWQNRQTQEWEETTSFFNVVCWREMAENASESLQKGSARHRHRPPRAALAGRPRRARSARWSRSSPTRSAPACAGPPPTSAERPPRARRRRRRRRVAAAARGGGGERRQRRPDDSPTTRSPSRWHASNDRDRDRRARPKDTAPPRARRRSASSARSTSTWVDYKDVNLLRRFMSDRGKIRARRVIGNCAQHQREVAVAIKTARELALLPYTQRTVSERRPRVAAAVRAAATAASPRGAPMRVEAELEPTVPTDVTPATPTLDVDALRRRRRRPTRPRSDEDATSEDRPARRRRQRRQEGRHPRRRRRLRPQLPDPARARPSRPPRASQAQAAAMRRSRDVKDAARPRGGRVVARTLVPEVIRITAQAGSRGPAVRLGHHRRRGRRRAGPDRRRARPAPAPPRRAHQERSAPTRCR